jgi:hypothetical protein
MIDVADSLDLGRLRKAIQRSRDVLSLFDNDRTEMIRDFAGPLYSPNARRRRTRYINKLNTTACIYQMALCFQNPRCKITSFDQQLWPFARKYEANVNRVTADIDLRSTLQECVLDAFFLLGAAKVRMADAGMKEVEPNVWLDPGRPWVQRVPFSDLILDMPGRSINAMRFYGDRYRAPFDAVRDRDDYDAKVRSKLSPSSKLNQNADSDRADQIAHGNSVDDDELEPMLWLMDVYLPRERQFLTLSADNDTLPPLKVSDWDGSERGPYKFLSLGNVPDNVMPSTPAQQLVLLDRLMNRLYKKLSTQADRQKNFVMVPKGGEKDGEAIKSAQDGEYITVLDPKSAVPVNMPGVDGNTNAFFLAAGEIYNTQAGNERILGGLGTEADTATQEKMLAGSATGRIGFMKGAVYQFTAEILREVGGLMWKDESLQVNASLEGGNTGYYLPPDSVSWKPGKREGKFDHYDFSVEPNSMAFRPPEAKLATLKQFAADYLQIMPAIQAGIFDGQEFTRIYADYTNTPEILRLAKQMQQQAGASDPHQASKPANTSREVVRSSGSGAPQGQGMAQVMGQMMQGREQTAAPMMGAGR